MSETTFLELEDHVGVSADGNLEPLVAIGVTVVSPTLVINPETGKQEPAEVAETLTIEGAGSIGRKPARFVPGTRIVEVADARVVDVLLSQGNWRQIDPPSKKDAAAAAKTTQDAAEEAGTHTEDEEVTS